MQHTVTRSERHFEVLPPLFSTVWLPPISHMLDTVPMILRTLVTATVKAISLVPFDVHHIVSSIHLDTAPGKLRAGPVPKYVETSDNGQSPDPFSMIAVPKICDLHECRMHAIRKVTLNYFNGISLLLCLPCRTSIRDFHAPSSCVVRL
jgi:hypothetical protein